MGVIPTRTDVISIVCVITFPAAWTGLTCISWVDIYNFNSCKGSLVFNEFSLMKYKSIVNEKQQ